MVLRDGLPWCGGGRPCTDRYLVRLLVKGRGRGSGVWIEAKIGHVITLRDGRGARLETHVGWDTALEAVGLSK